MARLSTYAKDATITGQDKLVGSNYGGLDNQGRPIFTTANYKIEDLLTYFQQNITIGETNLSGISGDLNKLKENYTYDANGNITGLSSAFVGIIASSAVSDNYATATFQTNVESSVLTFDGQGGFTVSEAFANQVMTTETTTDYASAQFVQNVASSIGTVDENGNITVSEAFANSVMSTENTTDYAAAQLVNQLSTTVSNKPNIYRQEEPPALTVPLGSLWYDTNDGNKLYILVEGDPDNVWTLTDDSRIGTLVSSTNTISQTLGGYATDIGNNAIFATNLAGSFGTYDAQGNLTSLSTAFANSVMTTETATNYADAGELTTLEGIVAVKPNVYRQNEPPAIYSGDPAEQVIPDASIWYDTDDDNKVYIVAEDPENAGTRIWTLTDDSRIGATASKITSMAAKFGTFDVNNDFTISGSSDYLDTVITKVDADSATAAKIENLGAELGTFDETNNFSTSLSADFKTAINNEVDANSATASYVNNLSAAVGIDKLDGTPQSQATALVNGATNTTTVSIIDGVVAGSKQVVLVQANSDIKVGQYVTYSAQTSTLNRDLVWRVEAIDGINIYLDNEISLEDATELTFTGTNLLTVDNVSGTIREGFQIKGEGITPGTFVSAVNGNDITLSLAENLADNTPLEFLGIYAAVTETAKVVAKVDGSLESTYGLQVDANGNVAGMKLLANNEGSEVSFLADSFKVYNGTEAEAPFEVVDGIVKIKSANIGTVNFGDLDQVPDTLVVTVVYADDADGTNASTTKGTKNFYGIFQGPTAWVDGDAVTGITFNQITGDTGPQGPQGEIGPQGPGGLSGKTIKLLPTKHVINYSESGSESDTITFTTQVQNIEGTATYRFYINDVAQGTQATTTSNFTLPDANEPASGGNTTVKVNVYDDDVLVATDSVTIYGVQNGSDAIIGFLTNSSHTVTALNDGSVPSFTGAGGTFKVFVGGQDVTSSCTFAVVTEVGVDVSINASSGVYTVSSMSADTGTATFSAIIPAATAKTANNVTVTADYSISKSIKGDTGPTGENGLRTVTGVLFWSEGSATAPDKPVFDANDPTNTNVVYTYATGVFSGLGLDTNGANAGTWQKASPSMAAGTASNKYWTVDYTILQGQDTDATATLEDGEIIFGSPVQAFAFNQVVTFSSLSTSGSTTINGDNITTGVIKDNNYAYTSGNYSNQGTEIDLSDGSITSESFYINGTTGAAGFKGDLEAAGGTFKGAVDIVDSDNDTVVKIHSGGLGNAISVTGQSATFPNISNMSVDTWDSSDDLSTTGATISSLYDDTNQTIYGAAESITFAAGSYTHSFSTNATSDDVLTMSANSYGFARANVGIQFGNSDFSTIYYDQIFPNESAVPGDGVGIPAVPGLSISLVFAQQTTVYARLYVRRTWKINAGSISFTSRSVSIASDMVFDGKKGKAEISPDGIKIFNTDDIYFKIDRANFTSGNPYVDIGGDVKVDGDLEITGDINFSGDVNNSDVTVANLQNRLSEISSNTYIGSSSGSATFTVRDNLVVDGSLTVNGTTTTVNTSNLSVSDNLIHVADNNNLNTVDLGIVGHYSDDNGTTANHVGMFWDASASNFKFFDNYTKDEVNSATVDTAHSSFALAEIQAASFKVSSSQLGFLKANGTIDTNTYASTTHNHDGDYLSLADGGTVDGNVKLSDNVRLDVGTGSDLRLFHNATNSYIQNITGNLELFQAADDADIILRSDDGDGGTTVYLRCDGSTGAVTLAHYGTTKLSTTSAGVSVTGTLTATSLVKSGGTSSQFLKADGSVDSNTYLTSESDTLQTVTNRGATTSNSITVANGTITIEKNGIGLEVENTANSGADTGIRIRGARNGQNYANDNLTSYILFSNYDDNSTPSNYDLAKIGAGMYDGGDDTGFFQIQVNDGTSLVKAFDIEKNKDATFYGNLNISSQTLKIGGTTVINSSREFYVPQDGLHINALAVTTTAAELNILDGATVTTTELNKLDGFTGSATDLNYAKDLRATGVTAAEFDYLDGVTSNIQTQINNIDAFKYKSVADIEPADGYISLFEMKTPSANLKGGSSALVYVRTRWVGSTSSVKTSCFFNITASEDGLITVEANSAEGSNVRYKIIQDNAYPSNYIFQIKSMLASALDVECFMFETTKKGSSGSGEIITTGFSTYTTPKEHDIYEFSGKRFISFDNTVTGTTTVDTGVTIDGSLTVNTINLTGLASSGGRTTETTTVLISAAGGTYPTPRDLAELITPPGASARSFLKFTVFGGGQFLEKKYVCDWNNSASEWSINVATEESSGTYDVQYDFTDDKFKLHIVDGSTPLTYNAVTVTIDHLGQDVYYNSLA